MKTTKNPEALTRRCLELEKAITEIKKRVPAHSAKPSIMMELMALEDEYHEVLTQINALKSDNDISDNESSDNKIT